ncbi:ZrgA family zinc uptake protein [Endozoicomonas acroporae]|uniref:ZrgA family zinc uptake protein n=1 Tax=Endozoicomonas acroporae TaxID=1701104 RepID=UPI003D7A3AC0
MNIHHKAVTASLILGLTVAITSSHGKDRSIGQNIHRAYEPASMLLDVNLQQDTLNLFLSISPEAANTITTLPPGALARSLQEFNPLVNLPDDAQCRQTQKQFLVEPVDSYLKAELLAAQLSEINGYLEYECQHPENLSHLSFLAFEAIPDLKHTSVWLVSDNWQSKQRLSQKQQEVQLQPAKSHFLPDFFND